MKLIKIVSVVTIISLSSYFAGYFLSKNSDAYLASSEFIMRSVVVSNEFGGIKNINLSPFGYELEFAGPSGSAEFELNIVGGDGKLGVVHINLMKKLGRWRVAGATLLVDGKKIDIPPSSDLNKL
jgi:hypothetical protein